ncbi:AraC family transcriptional regulator ligand-binding domain-containing protein [Bradyrhizobium brasilense]|uniref:AraC family transcriptional regulator ligand-binding domain-containing protein n=1 Tax=Bradyrhizobium brasilense TaxID=1419277 RepID=UPI001E57E0A6|nr:AraC family transcriptional regulator ligand-binding domain-containing protein [Bradyrhizobium brasilense]
MSGIPLTRCQFVIPFADIHNEVGAPTATLLSKFGLPTALQEKADHYVPILPAILFAQAAQRSQGITDIGFHASRRLQFCHRSDRLRTIISYSPTLYVTLQQVCKWASLEDTNLYMWLERRDDRARICSKLGGTAGMLHLEHSQWLQNVFVVHIVRQLAGSEWTPSTMAFEANYAPGSEAQAFWPNTRFLLGQEASWIDVPVAHLDLPSLTRDTALNFSEDEPQPFGDELVRALMLPSYLDEGIPAVAKIAEMAGASVGSFQRKFSNAGLTY